MGLTPSRLKDAETEAQRGSVTCPTAEAGLDPRLVCLLSPCSHPPMLDSITVDTLLGTDKPECILLRTWGVSGSTAPPRGREVRCIHTDF